MKKRQAHILCLLLVTLLVLSMTTTAFAAPKIANIYKPGKIYEVGVDIPAGEYYLKAGKKAASFEIHDAEERSEATLLLTYDFNNSTFIKAADGQFVYFKDCDMYALSKAPKPKKDKKGEYPAGMYKIGTTIPMGSYIITPTGSKAARIEGWDDCTYQDPEKAVDAYINTAYTIYPPKGAYIYIEDATIRQLPPMLKSFSMSPDQFLESFKKYDVNAARLPLELFEQYPKCAVYKVYERLFIEVHMSADKSKVTGASAFIKYKMSEDSLKSTLRDLDNYSKALTKVLVPSVKSKQLDEIMDMLFFELGLLRYAYPNGEYIYAVREVDKVYFLLENQYSGNDGVLYFSILTEGVFNS